MGLVILVDSIVWAAWSVLTGFVATRVPAERLAHDTWLTRIRAVERDGRTYESLAIRRWKDRLPEAGTVFGGASKRKLFDRSTEGLARFAAETRRAEIVHWLGLAIVPVFALWNPPVLLVAMAVYGVVANLPCIAIQRYNRARIARLTHRRSLARELGRPLPVRRSGRADAVASAPRALRTGQPRP